MDSFQLESINKELNKIEMIEGIIGTAVVDHNGLTIISRLPRSIEERKFGAIAATILGAMETAAISLKESLYNLSIEFENSQLIILASENNVIIVVLIEKKIDFGFILLASEEIIDNIKTILGG